MLKCYAGKQPQGNVHCFTEGLFAHSCDPAHMVANSYIMSCRASTDLTCIGQSFFDTYHMLWRIPLFCIDQRQVDRWQHSRVLFEKVAADSDLTMLKISEKKHALPEK